MVAQPQFVQDVTCFRVVWPICKDVTISGLDWPVASRASTLSSPELAPLVVSVLTQDRVALILRPEQAGFVD